jgi:hypothetical protein
MARFAKDGDVWATDPSWSEWDRTRAIRDKLVDGWRPIAWDTPRPAAAPPRDPAAEARLAGDGAPVDDFLVYSDWLQSAGNPRGALISVQHQLDAAADGARLALGDEERRLLDEHREALLGPLAGAHPSFLHLEWRLGFIRGARLHRVGYVEELPLAEELLWHLLDDERGPFLERLVVGLIAYGDNDNQAITAILMDPPSTPAPLRVLKIGAFGGDDLFDRGEIDISRAWLGPLVRLSSLYPRLEVLELTGRLNGRRPDDALLGEIDLPTLRRFVFRNGGLPREHLAEVLAARWPRLEELDLWFGDEDYGGDCTIDDVVALLDGRVRLPSLRRLGLRNASFTDALCEPLLRSPLLPQLEEVDLSLGVLTDEGAAILARGHDRLAHLRRLDLRENALSPAGRALVADLCRDVETADNDPEWRYVSVSE